MKSAVFALLFSSVAAQWPKEGSEKWDKAMKEQKMMAWKMYKMGENMAVDMNPRKCRISRDCPMQYR